MKCNGCSDAIRREADEIVEKTGSKRDFAIPLLQEIQVRHGYLPEELVEAVAKSAGIPFAALYGVATFYAQFRFTPQGKHLVKICKGTACHVQGAELLSATIGDTLGIAEGETSADRLFTFESVACLGCCSLAPVVMINDKIYGKLTSAKVKQVLKEYRNG